MTTVQNYDSDLFYFNLISKDLYKTTYYNNQSFSSPKLTILNKLNRSHYWFPANTGSHLEKKKVLKLRHKPVYSTFSLSSPVFLDLIKLQIKSVYNVDVDCFVKSSQFNTTLGLLNETFRKQNFKKSLPRVKQDAINTWNRLRPVSRNLYLTYFIDFSPHRSLSKFRKFSFISLNAWWFESKWIFVFFKMNNKYFKR